MISMKFLSEHIDELAQKRHGENYAGARVRAAERAAERAVMHNPLLVVSAVAALITMIFVPPSPAYFDYFNWHTLTCLLCILMVVSVFDSSGLLEFLAHSMVERVKSLRTLVIVLVLVTLCCSMILSNDMTLVSVLPLAVLLLKSIGRERDIPFTFIVITLTANLGGMLLPFGNPHNLYLYTMFGVDFADFVLLMAPPLILSMALILLRCLFVQKADFRYRKPPTIILSMPHVITYSALFALCIAMTVGVISYPVGALVMIAVLALADRTVFAKTDYALVLTFVCFFVFSGNIAQIPEVSRFFTALLSNCGAFVAALISSQVISNVPTAILLSNFTGDWAGIALGTNIGAVGTPISSLATLITLRQYQKLTTDSSGNEEDEGSFVGLVGREEELCASKAEENPSSFYSSQQERVASSMSVPEKDAPSIEGSQEVRIGSIAVKTGDDKTLSDGKALDDCRTKGRKTSHRSKGANPHGLASNRRFLLRFEAYNFAFLTIVALFEFFVMGIR